MPRPQYPPTSMVWRYAESLQVAVVKKSDCYWLRWGERRDIVRQEIEHGQSGSKVFRSVEVNEKASQLVVEISRRFTESQRRNRGVAQGASR
jgi:hypothetical protein